MNEATAEIVEWGASDGEYRLWVAKEAQRQGEMIFASQTADLSAAETRATSLIGWTVAGALAGAAVLAGHQNAHENAVIAVTGAPVIVAIAACAAALWPKPWARAGTDLAWMTTKQGPDDCELNTLEAMAAGYLKAAKENDLRLEAFAAKMKIAWIAFLATPIAAVGAILLFS
jgi:hypothetical protein